MLTSQQQAPLVIALQRDESEHEVWQCVGLRDVSAIFSRTGTPVLPRASTSPALICLQLAIFR